MTSTRVMIVEDEFIVAMNLESRLRGLGYRVSATVSSGEEAILQATEIRPDLVLMDIKLDGDMDGVEAAEEIQSHLNIPVVYLTGYVDDDTLERAKSTEPFGYIIKPFELKDLRSSIEIALYKHKMDRRLRESQERYRAISEVTSDFAYAACVEPDGGLVYEWITDAFTHVTGFTLGQVQQRGGWEGLAHPDDVAPVREHLRTLLSGWQDTQEFRIVTADGDHRWVCASGRPVFDQSQQRVVRIIEGVQDITGRRRAEEKIRQRNEELRILNAIASAVGQSLELEEILSAALEQTMVALEAEGGVVYLADETGQAFAPAVHRGLSQEVLEEVSDFRIGEGLSGHVAETGEILIVDDLCADPRNISPTSVREGWRSYAAIPLRSRGKVNGVMTLITHREGNFGPRHRDLADHVGSTIGVALENARLYTAVQQELSARKRMERVLRRRNYALALLNRLGQELAATLDLQGIADRLLRAIREVVSADGASVWLWDEGREGWLVCWAMSHHGLKKSPVKMCLLPGQGIAGQVAQTGKAVVVGNAPEEPHFFSGIDEELGFRTRSLLAVPLRARGTIVGVLEVVHGDHDAFDADDSALVQTLAASAAIAIDNAHLVERLHQQTDDLQSHNEELDAFAHTVAHDLKNPLGLLIGYAEVLEQNAGDMPVDDVQKRAGIIAQNGRRMSNIVDELLLLSLVRKTEVEVTPLDMKSVVAEVHQRMADMIARYQAEIILPESWPAALGYAPWVEQVWVNYLSNALQYGGRPPRVELGAEVQTDGRVRFWVRDNGRGLTPEEQAGLFTPFTRLRQVRAKGYGLGLSIVRRIIEKLGGEVGVESEVGQGSTFTFTLPGVDAQ